jgi:very-short-patch-repair endonuclease
MLGGMADLDVAVRRAAQEQHFLITRSQVLDLGGSPSSIDARIKSGAWIRRQCGVIQIDQRSMSWKTRMMAAVLAAGDGALVSHRAAFVLWGLDGFATEMVELTVPYTHGPVPRGVVLHRTRRPEDGREVDGIPITSVERALLDCSARFDRRLIGKGLDSAIRKNLTTVDDVYDLLVAKGGRGVKGTRTLRWVLRERLHDTATDSGAEYDLLYHMQMAFLPRPELHHPVFVDGRRVPDFYWPHIGKAVEVDGVDAHSSADKLDDDLKRQNALMDIGIELRRFSAREVHRNPKGVVAQISQFLAG